MGDFYNRPRNHVDVPIYGEYVGAFERLALDRDPQRNLGIDATTLIGDIVAEYLRRPPIKAELSRLRRRDDVAEAQRLAEHEERSRLAGTLGQS
jgi:hypothetical protein